MQTSSISSSTMNLLRIGAATTAIAATSYLLYRKFKSTTAAVATVDDGPLTVTELNVYPVKGLKGMSVKEWRIGERGFVFDRSWMVVTKNQGNETDAEYKFITQRQIARMCLVGANIDLEENTLTLYSVTNDKESFVLDYSKYLEKDQRVKAEIWRGVFDAVDMGDEVAQWLSTALAKEGCRLVMVPNDLDRHPEQSFYREIMNTDDELLQPSIQTGFADGFPYLIATENSLEDINKHVSKKVDLRRFRANITVGYNSGLKAFEEELWKMIQIAPKESTSTESTDSEKNEPVVMYNVKACTRCSVPNIDPDTAQRDDKGPSYQLTRYHAGPKTQKPLFGINVMTNQGSINKTIRVGDVVTVVSKHNQVPESE
jgi:uncharacterized protein YcbX